MKKTFLFLMMVVLGILALAGLVRAASPYGANYTEINTSSARPDDPIGIPAYAGNVTEMNVFGYSTTQSWQGYFGNVTGTIQLSDVNSNSMYNWSLASPQGEIYAANESSVSWVDTMCFNYTAAGTYVAENENRGANSKYGMNISQLETAYNIRDDDVDGVNETFVYQDHQEFYTSNLNFSAGECRNTRIFSDAGEGQQGVFEEVLLYDSFRRVPIFTSLLEEDRLGFDSRHHDFEMLVLDDGHAVNTNPTTYYFYVELE